MCMAPLLCGPVAVPLAASLERGGGREGEGVSAGALQTMGGGGTWKATYYDESYNAQQLGCPGSGLYDSANPAIVAVGPSHYLDIPCGTALTVCGAAGCIAGWREDACVGCTGDWVDLSEAGIMAVCGDVGSCHVDVSVVE